MPRCDRRARSRLGRDGGDAAEHARPNDVLERRNDDVIVLEHPTGTFDAAVDLARRQRCATRRTGRHRQDGTNVDGRFRLPASYRDPADASLALTPIPTHPAPSHRHPNACDAHCHVFGPADRFPFADDRAYTPPDSGIDKFEALQERLGLTRAVFVQASCHGTDNAAMVDAIERGNGRYAGVAMIDESFSDADIGNLHDVGVRGTRFNFVAHLGGAPELDVFWRIVDRVARSVGTSCCTSTPRICRRTPSCSTACHART